MRAVQKQGLQSVPPFGGEVKPVGEQLSADLIRRIMFQRLSGDELFRSIFSDKAYSPSRLGTVSLPTWFRDQIIAAPINTGHGHRRSLMSACEPRIPRL
jgi:hypothetical protein